MASSPSGALDKSRPEKTFALVLGGGGLVGLAYHAGVLCAFEDANVATESADLIVGTSAGSVIGAYLRNGWTPADLASQTGAASFLRSAVDKGEPAALDEGLAQVISPASTSALGIARRALGSAYVLSRSALHFPVPQVPGRLARAFPAGMLSMAAGRQRLEKDLPPEWPLRPLRLTAYDITRGRRVVMGGPGVSDIELDLPSAVRASCAVPGVFPPVRSGSHVLADGGVTSTTNLDLAAGYQVVLCVAPMASAPGSPPGLAARLARTWASRSVALEAARLRRSGSEVLLIRPTAAEVSTQGTNLMRHSGLDLVAECAYDATVARLASERFRRVVDILAA